MADAFRQGSHASDSVTGLKSFWGYGTAGTVFTFRKQGQSSGYQVTAGTTLYITRISIGANDGNSDVNFSIGYGDTDVGMASAANPTNPVKVVGNNNIGSTTTNQSPFIMKSTTGTNPATATFNVLVEIPASKYPYGFVSNASAVYIEGYEA